MRISPHRLSLLAAACGAAAITLAPAAQAGADDSDCSDDSAVSLCHKPTPVPTFAGGYDPTTQQLLGPNMVNPTPPIGAIG